MINLRIGFGVGQKCHQMNTLNENQIILVCPKHLAVFFLLMRYSFCLLEGSRLGFACDTLLQLIIESKSVYHIS